MQNVCADPAKKILTKDLKAFKQYCEPRKKPVFEHYQFWQLELDETEEMDHFVMQLRCRAHECEYGTSEDVMIRYKIVFSVPDYRSKENRGIVELEAIRREILASPLHCRNHN